MAGLPSTASERSTPGPVRSTRHRAPGTSALATAHDVDRRSVNRGVKIVPLTEGSGRLVGAWWLISIQFELAHTVR
jgi:hypothetical protein